MFLSDTVSVGFLCSVPCGFRRNIIDFTGVLCSQWWAIFSLFCCRLCCGAVSCDFFPPLALFFLSLLISLFQQPLISHFSLNCIKKKDRKANQLLSETLMVNSTLNQDLLNLLMTRDILNEIYRLYLGHIYLHNLKIFCLFVFALRQ